MSAILNGNNSVNRLIETLAGSAVLLSNPASATSALPISLSPLLGGSQTDGSTNASASANDHNANATIDLTSLVASGNLTTGADGVVGTVMATLGVGNGDTGLLGSLPVVGNIAGGADGGIPVVSDVLGGNLLGGELPIVGNVLGSNGLPVVGDVLGSGTTPVLGNVLGGVTGGDGLPVVGDLLGSNSDSLPIVGNLLGSDGLPIVGNLVGNVVQDLTGVLGSSPLTLAGTDGTLQQPVFDPLNTTVKEVHAILETLSHTIGTSDITHAVTSLGETIGLGEIGNGNNLVTDVVNLPGSIVDGTLNQSLDHIGSDLTHVVQGVGNLVDTVLFDQNDPLNPLPDILQGVGHVLQTGPLLTIAGGNDGNSGLLGGIVGDLSQSSSGHVIDIDLGPTQQSGGLPLDILAAHQSGPSHTVEINAIDVGNDGPHLLDLGLLTGNNGPLDIPSIIPSAGGSDGLVGNLLGTVGNLLGGVGGSGGSSTTISPVTTVVADVHDVAPITSTIDHGPLNLNGLHIL